MNTYVCTCGTSIITKRGINIERIQHLPLSERNNKADDLESIEQRVMEELERISLPAGIDETSAEIKSLLKMGLTGDDRVILIASDTLDGELCAGLVKQYLVEKELCQEENVEIKPIAGLQARDGKRFQIDGLKNLLGFLVSLEYENVILNPTGGFKSVVPYISLIGMLFNRPVKYIHEDSNDVITLVNVPVLMNEEILFLVEEKLRKIDEKSSILKSEWQGGIAFDDRRFDSLIEEDGNEVTLSGIGLLFWERFKLDYPATVELMRDLTAPNEKPNKLLEPGIGHHGMEKLKPLAARLLQSVYVKGIPNSCDNQPRSRHWIKALKPEEAKQHLQRESQAICIITDIRTDAGYSFLIETTARDFNENARIAEILEKKYLK